MRRSALAPPLVGLRPPVGFAILLAMFSPAVIDHFRNPRNVGDLEAPTAVVEVANPVCGDVLRLAVQVVDGRIVAAKFRTRGCVSSIACSSLLTELMMGRTVANLAEITPGWIAERLGGLETATAHAADLARDAVAAVMARLS